MRVMRGRSWRRRIEGLALAFTLLVARSADASDLSRVAFVGDDPELLRALGRSLATWQVEVVPAAEPQLGATLPEGAAIAEAVCARTGAQAAVWISRSAGGWALWVYDARTHELVSRAVTDEPPYSGPVAAALSLSTKTLLKKSLVAPETERFGASAPAPPRPPVAPPEAKPSALYLEGSGGARFFAISIQPAEARFGLGVSYWSRSSPAIGGFVDVSLGPGVNLASSKVDAHYVAIGAAAGVRGRIDAARWLALEGGLGFVMGITSFSGVADGESVAVLRANPAARIAFVVDFKLGNRTSIGLVNSLDAAFRRQDYTFAGATVAEGGFFTWDLALRLRVGAD